MKIRTPIMAALLVASLLAGTIVPTSAVTRSAVITIAYGVRVRINELDRTFTDANGSIVQPFVSNGTTYVPIRAVSNLLGADVKYDNKTKAIDINNYSMEIVLFLHRLDESIDTLTRAMYTLSISAAGNSFSDRNEFASDYQMVNETSKVMVETMNKFKEIYSSNPYAKSYIDSAFVSDCTAFYDAYTNFGGAYLTLYSSNTSSNRQAMVAAGSDLLKKEAKVHNSIHRILVLHDWSSVLQ